MGEGSKTTNKYQKTKKSKNNILENGESFKDWGSRVQAEDQEKKCCTMAKAARIQILKIMQITETAEKMENYDTCCDEK